MTTSITKLLKSTQSSSMLAKYLLPVLALLLIVAFSLYLPDTFPTSVTVRSIIDAQAITALLALAEMLVVIAGEYDLSVGYSCGMINILVIGFIVKDHVPLPLTIILALVIGSGLGLINGLLVYVCKIDSFIATLGSGTVAYAVSNWYTQGNQVFGTLPTALTDIYTTRVFDVPIAAFMVVFVAGVLWFLLEYTPTGRRLYALGSNKRAAELTGILLASRLRIGEVSTGPDYLLPVFVGAILGSVTLKPGRPNAWGTVVAVLLLGIGIAGLQQMGASYYVTPLFDGLTLIVGVGAAGYANRRIRREPLRLDPGDGDDRPSAPALETNTTH
jgi:ribose transport system permease protein